MSISLVNSIEVDGTGTSTVTSGSLSITAGNMMVFIAAGTFGRAAQVISIVDSLGNTYTKVVAIGGSSIIELWYGLITVGGSTTFTVTVSSSGTIRLLCLQYNGVSAVDQFSSNTTGGSTSLASNSIVTTFNNELIVVGFNLSLTNTLTFGGGFTQELSGPSGAPDTFEGDQIVTTAGTYQATASALTTVATYRAVIVSFYNPLAYSSDEENQIQQSSYTPDNDLSDPPVEKITIPVVAYDTDADQQISQMLLAPINYNYQFLDMDWTWATNTYTISATDTILMGYYGYKILPGTQDHGNDWTQYLVPIVLITDYTWDIDDNVHVWPEIIRDDLYEGIQPALPVLKTYTWDDPSDNQLQQLTYQLDRDIDTSVYPFTPPIVDYTWDIDNHIPQALQLIIDDVEALKIQVPSLTFWESDAINQLPQLPQSIDLFDERPELFFIPVQEIDNDSEQQRAQLGYQFDGELLDTGVEKITALFVADRYDLIDKQFPQQPQLVFDIAEEQVQFVLLEVFDDDGNNKVPGQDYTQVWEVDTGVGYAALSAVKLISFDTDSEQQFRQADWYNDEAPSDVNLELITIYDYTWDTDENQIPQISYQFQDDVDHLKIQVPSLTFWESDAINQISQPPQAIDLFDERPELFLIPVQEIDNDAEQQLLQPLWNLDVIDERNELPIIPVNEWDNDSENQLQQLTYQLDRDVDTGVYTFTPPILDYTWDEDSNSRQWADNVKDQIQEEGIAQQFLLTFWDDDQELQQQQWALDVFDDRNLYPIIPVQEIDNDSEQQKLQGDYYKDHLSDEEVEKITIPVQVPQLYAWDTDAEAQMLQGPWNLDIIEERNELPIIPFQEIDLDAEQQFLQPAWNLDQIEEQAKIVLYSVIDLDAENQFQQAGYQVTDDVDALKIQIPSLTFWESDTINQISQPLWSIDVFDDRNNLPIIPIMEWDTDSEQQRLNPLPFGTDTLSDEGEELIILPAIVTTYTWDDVSESSFQWLDYYKDHLSDENTKLIILPYNDWSHDADNQKLQDTYLTDRDTADTGVELVQYAAGVLHGWDTDSDQQFQQLGYSQDGDLSDTGIELVSVIPITDYTWDTDYDSKQWADWTVDRDLTDTTTERIFIPVVAYDADYDSHQQEPYQLDRETSDTTTEKITIPVNVWDSVDIENQKQQDPYNLDRDLSDTATELITLFQYEWDTDAENQLQQLGYSLDRDLIDTGVERITVPAAYDTDSEQQFKQPPWNLDYEEEREGVPYIILKPGIVRDWDADIGNMIPQPGWVNDYQDFDLYQYIAPIVLVVPLLYKLTAALAVELSSIQPNPAVGLYELQTHFSMSIGQIQSNLSMSLYKITAANSITMQSFQVHGPI